ncbi:cysteine hydrolase [Paenibacillus pedocola]|uniref:cysteine hydrolase n=1 Tax=Paenibacillus pedocola TaxID=3242193 RepID=UPI0028779B82|nr:cysteine hydrolase [Paenibacillus typhae]
MPDHQNKAALLVLDMQNTIVSIYVKQEEVLLPFQRAVEAARKHGVPVIYAGVAVREDVPNSPRNKIFGKMTGNIGMSAVNPAMHVHESVKPQSGEPLVDKFRVSAFAGSQLEAILHERGIETLILSGIATSGVVLSTWCEAADKDFAVTVLSDACVDADPEVHRVLTEKVFPRQADVLTVEEWIRELSQE